MGVRDKEKDSFHQFAVSLGAEPVGRIDKIAPDSAEYRDELHKIARTLQDLSERTGTGSDLILCDLFSVLEIDASIKIRYGRTTRSLRTVTKVPVKGARK